jgi:hypothetical protein
MRPFAAAEAAIDPYWVAAHNLIVRRFSMMGQRNRLRRRDLVEVLPAAEILATLDDTGCLEGVPFMPEMLPYVGRRFTVEARVERACDTIYGSGARRMPNTALLDDLRCDGGGHGGCQAGCRLYWKEAWLRRVSRKTSPAPPSPDNAYLELERLTRKETMTVRVEEDREVEVYRCQATEFFRATEPISWRDVRSPVRELSCGNIGLWRFARVGARLVRTELRRKFNRLSNMPFEHHEGVSASRGQLGLKPGDLVRVRSKAEIAQTLDEAGKNRGLWFDKEMVPYCGETHRVKGQVERFIDERSGEMVELASDCWILDGVVCSGDLSDRRWFCPRAIYPWWRESWLRRAGEA